MPKLLVVDDALADRVRVCGIASRWHDCTVLEADNGRSALEQIETHVPDLVLTDLHMPEMDGLELVSAVKEEFPHIPVVLMTAKGSEDIAARALRQGAASYVPKVRIAEDLLPTLTQVYSTARDADSQSQVMHYLSNAVTAFSLPNDFRLLESCVRRILDMLCCVPLGDEAERLRVGIAIKEAALNACYHGNLNVGDAAAGDPSRYVKIAAERSRDEKYFDRRIDIRTDIIPERAIITIRDCGAGFDVQSVLRDNENPGRGLKLIHSIMDEVTFNSAGNEIRMVRRSRSDADPGSADGADDD